MNSQGDIPTLVNVIKTVSSDQVAIKESKAALQYLAVKLKNLSSEECRHLCGVALNSLKPKQKHFVKEIAMYKRELAQVIDGEGNTKEAVNMLKSVVYEGPLEDHCTEKI